MSSRKVPKLEGEALKAAESVSSHIQIIASAGSGKTETISQRVAKLVAKGVEPSTIVAFTFTNKAADELKERIRERVKHFAGAEAADKIGNMYVGTIHGYCLQMLQQHVPHYETYEMADENQLAAFTVKWDKELDLRRFDIASRTGGQLFQGMSTFLSNVAVVENELLNLDDLPGDFADAAKRLYELLDQHKMLTFGVQIAKAVEVLQDPEIHERVTSTITHLIVDEYQDVNVAQEKLISLLALPEGKANLVVVGDDDQAIYQWRGSKVENITTFTSRYPNVESFKLLTNRRSRPGIVKTADSFAKTIDGRLSKEMGHYRDPNGPSLDVATFEFEIEEATDIAVTIKDLVSRGFRYKDIAILVRTSTSYPRILEALDRQGIPVSPGDRVGLLEQDDAIFLAKVFAYFASMKWKTSKFGTDEVDVTLSDLLAEADALYGADHEALERFLVRTKNKVGQDTRHISLVDITYDLLKCLNLETWTNQDSLTVSRLGTIAKFVGMIADYEGIQKHSRQNPEGGQIGASDGRDWYFKGLVILMIRFSRDSYRDFSGEEDVDQDAVDLMTIHASKGLEWPIVFVPAVTGSRFPNLNKLGKPGNWLVPTRLFDASRYEGDLNDERRLFYVAITRGREWVGVSSHEKVNARNASSSPLLEALNKIVTDTNGLAPDWVDDRAGDLDQLLQISYSDLASYLNCGWSYWLRNRIGFPPAIVSELGYGKAVHHLMRVIAEKSTALKRPLTPREVEKILATDFFLPFANSALADNLKTSASRLIDRYMSEHAEDTTRTWQTERPFEIEIDGALVNGRADVILDKHEGVVDSLAIVDYKTSVGEQDFDLQLQIYAEAGTREGLNVSAAYVHDMQKGERVPVPIDIETRKAAIATAEEGIRGIKARKFEASPSVSKCGRCDVRAICRSAKTS